MSASYQQVPPEKGYFEAPPPYYNPNVNNSSAPLLPPPATATTTTVIVGKREGTSCCGIMCSITMVIISLIICCCCCAGIITAIIFGVWASQCSSLTYQLTLEHSGTLDGVGQKVIEIENHGTLTVNSVVQPSPSIYTSSAISANSYSAALDYDYENEVTPTSFTLKFESYLWSCTEQDVTVTLHDSPAFSPLELDLETYSGDLTLGSFLTTSFSEVSLKAASGDVSFGRLNVTDKLKVESYSGQISSSTGAEAGRKIELETLSGDISVSGPLITGELELTSLSGEVTLSDVTLRGTGECLVEVDVKSGNFQLDALRLMTTSSCNLVVETMSGDATLNIYGFVGTYHISSSGGSAYLNGVRCNREVCEGVIPGGLHTLEVRAYSGDAVVVLL